MQPKWLKIILFLLGVLLLVNLGLAAVYFGFNPFKRSAVESGSKDIEGFTQTNVGEQIEAGGYQLQLTKPRYENPGSELSFLVDVELINNSVKPAVSVTLNCDTSERQGLGVSVADGEAGAVQPGSQAIWTAKLILQSDEEKVLSCVYAPKGVFDPSQTVRIVF